MSKDAEILFKEDKKSSHEDQVIDEPEEEETE